MSFPSVVLEISTTNTNRGNHVANIGIGFIWGGSRTAKKP
jgi:hypothetical protein